MRTWHQLHGQGVHGDSQLRPPAWRFTQRRAANVREDPLKQMLTTDAFRSDEKGEQRTLGSDPEGPLCIILAAW